MSNPSVTAKASFEAVKAAADALAAEGLVPSVRTVMARTGGSPNTITVHLRTWREQRPAVEARKAIVLDERIHELLAGQISTAVAEATKLATAERDARADDLAEVEQRSTQLEGELETASARVDDLHSQVQRQEGQMQALQDELDHVKADAAASVQKARAEADDQVAAAQAEAAGERKKLDEMARQLGAAQEKAAEADRLRQVLATMTADRDAERTARVDAEKALAVAQAQAKDSGAQVAALTKRADALDAELGIMRSKLAAAEVTAGQVAPLNERVKALDGQVGTLRDKLATAESQAAAAQAQATERAERIADLQSQVKKAAETAAADKKGGGQGQGA